MYTTHIGLSEQEPRKKKINRSRSRNNKTSETKRVLATVKMP